MDGSIPGWKPGLYYGADEQCKIAFGSVATACTFADSNVVGRKFVCLAKGSREMLRSQNSGEGAGSVFILKGSKVLFYHRFLGKAFKMFPFSPSPLSSASVSCKVCTVGCCCAQLAVLGAPTQGPALGSSCSLDSSSFPAMAQISLSGKHSVFNSCHLDMFC